MTVEDLEARPRKPKTKRKNKQKSAKNGGKKKNSEVLSAKPKRSTLDDLRREYNLGPNDFQTTQQFEEYIAKRREAMLILQREEGFNGLREDGSPCDFI